MSSQYVTVSVSLSDIHTFQRIYGCEWEDQVYTSDEYRYDGEGFMEFNLTAQTWIPSTHPQALNTKFQWDRDKERIKNIILHLTNCSDWLKKYLDYANNTLQRTELPSVSLLQKTPSSPVSCHATGFYPDSATLIWRKDGEEIHEDVDHGEILLNHDGSFQMSVDLNLSSVTPEDWRRYDCVFQLSGVKNDIVIKLDKAVIRTNEVPVPSPASSDGGVTGGVAAAVFVVVAAFITGYFIWRKKCHAEKGQTRNGQRMQPLVASQQQVDSQESTTEPDNSAESATLEVPGCADTENMNSKDIKTTEI
ncbi:major histocompatibility complex class I-related gene protein-like [Dicentrarchus labrax]|uniref:major histocompatibility complex class I-related gene protein-like n=1 Tax=Dicentrarchus labrax TaxID=13489 RepID=UPI0021F5A213|nr:major histocompatibility complex class I-related gene protein-like [Dicentrarchus labrax]